MKSFLRLFARAPGFALVSILTVALGIGSVTAIYSVARAVVFRPLPFADEDSLAWVWSTRPDRDRAFFSIPHFQELKATNTSTVDLAAITPLGITVTGFSEPERVQGWLVTPNLFPLLGTEAHLGRLPGIADELPGATPVAALGYGYWRRRFGGDPTIVGQSLVFNGTAHTVVGILPPTFFIPTWESDVLLSLAFDRDSRREARGIQFLRAIARLKPGVTPAAAEAEFANLTRLAVSRHPETDASITPPRFVPLRTEAIAGYGNSLRLLLGAAAVLLLVTCTNLAGLFAARALAQQRDAAVRLALGARASTLFRTTLGEGLWLAGCGGLLGLTGCALAIKPLLGLAPADLPRAALVTVDANVAAVGLGCTLLLGFGISLLPAWRLARTSPHDALRGVRTATGRSGRRNLLVGCQLALCTVLLVGTGLLARSVEKLFAAQPGFDARGVLVVQAAFGSAQRDFPALVASIEECVRRLKEMPGVSAASLTSILPLSGVNTRSEFTRADRPPAKPTDTLSAANRFVLEDYFRTVGIPLHAGRELTANDDARSRRVVVIDRALAERHWPGENPLGQTIIVPDGRARTEYEIVGVAGSTKHFSLEEAATPALYFPVRQMPASLLPFFASRINFVVRTAGDPASLKEPARRTLRALDPAAVVSLRTLDEANAWAKAPRIFNARLLGFFGALSLLLVTIGLYAVTAQAVTARTREIGIRMALGADNRRVVREVLGDGLRLVALGIGIGLVLAYLLAPLGRSLLFQINFFDPATYGVIAVSLGGVAVLAAWLPARRAAQVDPIITLRGD
ncbi:MAG: hypothetical protein C0518_13445 [Opitutus sp.]|nr:hypothetical protein [Opitutus sp.]